MREFRDISSFVWHLGTIKARQALEIRNGLERAARIVEKQAKEEIGHYQPQTGEFAAWPELAESTKADRVAQGFSENDPLLRTGKLRDSISHQVDGLEAVIGSDSDVAVWQELGTKNIPPRSFLGTALVNKEGQVAKTIGAHAVGALLHGTSFSYPALLAAVASERD